MTTAEFSNEFDILYNNTMSNQAPGLDEYEKSVFLTLAQKNVIRGIYTGTLSGESFDQTEATKRALANLTETGSSSPITSGVSPIESSNSNVFKLESNVWYITYEELRADGNKRVKVIPITIDEYHRLKENPFKRQSSSKALRLESDSTTISSVNYQCVEIISSGFTSATNITYYYKYIRKPHPIILTSLADTGLKIDNEETAQTSELSENLHPVILAEAVRLAVASKAY